MNKSSMEITPSKNVPEGERIKVFPSINLGFHTKIAALSLADFVRLTVVANREYLEQTGGDPNAESQRPLNEKHALSLAQYMLKGLATAAQELRGRRQNPPSAAIDTFLERMGRHKYLGLAPVIAAIPGPGVKPGPNALPFADVLDTTGQKFGEFAYLGLDQMIHVIDGQHRRFAASAVLRFLEDVTKNHRYPKKGSLFPFEKGEVPSKADIDGWLECLNMAHRHAFISIELHLGLTADQQRQLFYDLNNRGLKVSPSMAVKFDDANPAIRLAKELQQRKILKIDDVVKKTWDDDDGSMLYKDVVGVTSLVLANSKSEKGVQARHGDQAHRQLAMDLWTAIAKVPGFGTEKSRNKTVVAQPVVLKGAARAVYESAWIDNNLADAQVIIKQLPKIDFSHQNKIWQLYLEPSVFSQDPSLTDYVPAIAPSSGFVELDKDGYVRFRLNHSDIYPIVAALIRKMAGLRPRKK